MFKIIVLTITPILDYELISLMTAAPIMSEYELKIFLEIPTNQSFI